MAIIGEDTHVRVSVGSWLGQTKEVMEQKLLKYYSVGLINQSTALKLLEFGNIDEIIKQTRMESLLKRAISQGAPGQPPETDQFGLATTENTMMGEGKDMPVDSHDDHFVHIAVHQDALGRGFDDLVGKHMQIHQMYLTQEGGTQPVGPTDDIRNQQIQAQQTPQGPPQGQPPPGGMPGGGGMPQGMQGGAPQQPMGGMPGQ